MNQVCLSKIEIILNTENIYFEPPSGSYFELSYKAFNLSLFILYFRFVSKYSKLCTELGEDNLKLFFNNDKQAQKFKQFLLTKVGLFNNYGEFYRKELLISERAQ